MTILCNMAQCLLCGQVIESKHRHDYVSCRCDNLFVDGGLQYLRRGWEQEGSWKELSEVADEDGA